MNYLSVCSGIEAATVAWHPLGWTPVAFSEIDAFPRAVLAHHYPSVPNWGDMTKFREWPDATVDVLVGGTPCQSFSVAGLRKGLDDPRGNLMLVYLAIADRYRPEWVVWENVPGVLSSNGGRDFAAFLGGLAELGYGWAYRVLDAQYYGVAQRRRRVFVVGSARGWQRAAAVLFERASLRGDPAPRRETREVAPTIPARRTAGGGLGTDFDCDGGVIQRVCGPIAGCSNGGGANGPGRTADDADSLVSMYATALQSTDGGMDSDRVGQLIPVAFDARQSEVILYGDKTGPLDTDGHSVAVAFSQNQRDEVRLMPVAGALSSEAGMKQQTYVAFQPRIGRNGRGYSEDVIPALNGADAGATSDMRPCVATPMAVRRLTPRECERLQGFPDDYTLIPYRGKPAADGNRYKALGNSMAVPVMRWIGKRIQAVEDIP